MSRIRCCLLLAFAALAPHSAATLQADETVPLKATMKVPFTLVPSGHFIVKVMLNGYGPYNLIFDTGAPTTLISPRIAGEAKLIDKVKDKPLIPLFGMMGQTKVKAFKVGDVEAEDIPSMIIDHPTVKLFSQEYEKQYGSIDGIVGFPFFAKFAMTVDYSTKEMIFTPNGYKPDDVMESMMKSVMGSMGGKKPEPKVAAAAGQWGIDVKKEPKDDAAGVEIVAVIPGSAADAAGLKVGDRLLTIAGRWTDSIADTHAAAGYAKPGKESKVTLTRAGKDVTLTVKPKLGL
jgi:PDZ domain/Aspartyl protease